ncbi:MAG: NUDIX hydrolase [Clostridia bacterium]|nr:NUDIX hydrolase [Clostridia bacterium]
MEDKSLIWKTENTELLLRTRVFGVLKQSELSPIGTRGDYIALDAPDCVVIIPELEGSFLLVRQWRHGADMLTSEFPGGVIDRGEAPETAAARELREETGFTAENLDLLGICSPNPALFKSRFYVYLARDLKPAGDLELDSDEFLNCFRMPIDEVIASFGSGEYNHAFMGAALMLYMRTQNSKE